MVILQNNMRSLLFYGGAFNGARRGVVRATICVNSFVVKVPFNWGQRAF